MPITLPIDRILASGPPPAARALDLGSSRRGRTALGYRAGRGRRHVSLIAGCHADEPIGPAMLDRVAGYLAGLPDGDPLLADFSWFLVPHVNPDGEANNRAWTAGLFDGPGLARSAVAPDRVDLAGYLRHAVRELPGDDVEFGFPRTPQDREARPENLAVADFLRPGAPYVLHGSFHGMAFAAGPWFLLERAWIGRTAAMRERLRGRVRALGYRLHDVDRRGEKGLDRIDEGFTTRPDSRAMAAWFEGLGDPDTAALFRPSSMELVRSLGGDPLTLVSEMPLFLAPPELYRGGDLIFPAELRQLRALAADPEALRAEARRIGVRPMPIGDQMRLQLEYLREALAAVVAQAQLL